MSLKVSNLAKAFFISTALFATQENNISAEEKKYTRDDFEKIVEEDPYPIFSKHFEAIKDEPFALDIIKKALSYDPNIAFSSYKRYINTKLAKDIIIAASKLAPESSINFFEYHKGDESLTTHLEAKKLAEQFNTYRSTLQSLTGFKEREKYLKKILPEINRSLPEALNILSKKTNMSIEVMGIKKSIYELVLMNTFKEKDLTPIRVGLRIEELEDKKTPEAQSEFIENKLKKEIERRANNYNIWKNLNSYNIQKNDEITGMIACVPYNSKGEEETSKRMLEIFTSEYGANIQSVCMQNKDRWKEVSKGIKLPEAKDATRKTILKELEKSLQYAVEKQKNSCKEKRNIFLFRYMAHGEGDPGIWSADEKITSEDTGKIISKYSSDLEIVIIGESCYAGNFLEGIRNHLKTNKIPVKKLILIGEAGNESGGAGLSLKTASLPCDKIRDHKSGVFAYYFSYYHELKKYLEEKGIKLNGELGSLSHAIRFTDCMTEPDDCFNQDVQGMIYSYDPEKERETLQQFSRYFFLSNSFS